MDNELIMLRLKEEIEHRTKLLNNLKRFETLSLDEKIQTIRQCTLRHERDIKPQILQSEFKSELLREHANAEISINNFILTYEDYTFSISLYNRKRIEIRSYKYPKALDNPLEYQMEIEKIKAENYEFLKLIEEDINYFKENGYRIYYNILEEI